MQVRFQMVEKQCVTRDDFTHMRLLIFGNSGSGKTTMAREVAASERIPHLDLDSLAWGEGLRRRPFEESAAELERFIQAHPDWIIEGCYGDLIALAVPHCTEMRFLAPGIESCVANCLARPWEPEKYPTPEAQNAMLADLLGWVREYETRTDEFSLSRHREIFEGFPGPKQMLTTSPRPPGTD